MLARGVKYDWGSLEDSWAIIGCQRRAEIEFRKILLVVSAILEVGKRIAAAVSETEGSSGKDLQKNIDSLQDLMLPHMKDSKNRQAARAKEILETEYKRGKMKVKAVGGHKEKMRGKVALRKKEE